MLCSICNKNQAVIFVNKKTDDGSVKNVGYCYECAKKQGINPLESLIKQANLSEKDLNDMSGQLEKMMTDLTQNMNMDAISEQMNNMDPEDLEEMENEATPIAFGAIPLGSIFSGMFGNKTSDDVDASESSTNSSSSSAERKKVKVKKDKKRKTL